MGSAAGKLLGRKGDKIEFMESTKMPTAKDIDMRRRNSLMFFMRDWQELSTFEEQEASMLQVQGNCDGFAARWFCRAHAETSRAKLCTAVVYGALKQQ